LFYAGVSDGKQAPGRQKNSNPREMAGKLRSSARKLLYQDALQFLEDSGAAPLFQATIQSQVTQKAFIHPTRGMN
jgi:hypothetical protein